MIPGELEAFLAYRSSDSGWNPDEIYLFSLYMKLKVKVGNEIRKWILKQICCPNE